MFPIITMLDELIMCTGHIYYPGDWGNPLFYSDTITAEEAGEAGEDEVIPQ